MTKRKLYLAGPLFNSMEREFSERIRNILLPSFHVFLPHVDGRLLPDLIAAGSSPHEARSIVFANDISALRGCDLLLAILNGRTIDEGTAFELGVAWCLGKPCWGFKDDFRRLTPSGDNPMIEIALRTIFSSFDELAKWAVSSGERPD